MIEVDNIPAVSYYQSPATGRVAQITQAEILRAQARQSRTTRDRRHWTVTRDAIGIGKLAGTYPASRG